MSTTPEANSSAPVAIPEAHYSAPVVDDNVSAPILAAGEDDQGNTNGTLEAEVNAALQSSIFMLTPFAGSSAMTGMTQIQQLR